MNAAYSPDLFPIVEADPAEVHRRGLIAAAEERGDLDPTCRTCREHLYPLYPKHFAPSHRSGCGATYNHCSCDGCF